MTDMRSHWENIYQTRAPTKVSWYQARPEPSLSLIAKLGLTKSASIIDVGGGASNLADHLLDQGFKDLTVLDISPAALAYAKERLGPKAGAVGWIEADITSWKPPRAYDLWHDRAVFHFLISRETQDAYLAALEAGTKAGGIVIMAAFALDGPERCSGLPVQRYSSESLSARLGPGYSLMAHETGVHVTPAEALQKFTFAVFRRL
jgi:SAM-dependent methyltransferase